MKRLKTPAGCLAILMLLLDITLVFFLPEVIAVQWNQDGVSNTASRWMIFVFPLLAGFFALYRGNGTAKSSEKIRLALIMVLFGCQAAILCNALGLINLCAMDFRFAEMVVLLVAGGLLIFFGNRLPKYVKNYYCGVKASVAYATDDLWTKTQRFAGKVWVLSGIVLMLLAFFPVPQTAGVVLVVLLLVIYLPRGYSRRLYEKHLSRK